MKSPYVSFPVLGTIDIKEISDIRPAVDRMIENYVEQEPHGRFSYRVLLQRDQKSNSKAKHIGLAVQGEFMLGLRKRNLLPRLREVRYVHDEDHFGWLLANPEVCEKFEKGMT